MTELQGHYYHHPHPHPHPRHHPRRSSPLPPPPPLDLPSFDNSEYSSNSFDNSEYSSNYSEYAEAYLGCFPTHDAESDPEWGFAGFGGAGGMDAPRESEANRNTGDGERPGGGGAPVPVPVSDEVWVSVDRILKGVGFIIPPQAQQAQAQQDNPRKRQREMCDGVDGLQGQGKQVVRRIIILEMGHPEVEQEGTDEKEEKNEKKTKTTATAPAAAAATRVSPPPPSRPSPQSRPSPPQQSPPPPPPPRPATPAPPAISISRSSPPPPGNTADDGNYDAWRDLDLPPPSHSYCPAPLPPASFSSSSSFSSRYSRVPPPLRQLLSHLVHNLGCASLSRQTRSELEAHWLPRAARVLGCKEADIDMVKVCNFVGRELRGRYPGEEERRAAMDRWRVWVRGVVEKEGVVGVGAGAWVAGVGGAGEV